MVDERKVRGLNFLAVGNKRRRYADHWGPNVLFQTACDVMPCDVLGDDDWTGQEGL